MAKNSSTVYLGFEDETINEKNKFFVNFATNKVGGFPVSFFNKKYLIFLHIILV